MIRYLARLPQARCQRARSTFLNKPWHLCALFLFLEQGLPLLLAELLMRRRDWWAPEALLVPILLVCARDPAPVSCASFLSVPIARPGGSRLPPKPESRTL